MEVCLILTAVTASNQAEVAAHLLPHVQHHKILIAAFRVEIVKAGCERSDCLLEAADVLLCSDFLGYTSVAYSLLITLQER